jgi:hypothetical protein
MRVPTLPVILSVFFLTIKAAFPQAASEWVLLKGNSATAAGKAGVVLGNSLNRTDSKTAGEIPKIPQPKAASSTSRRSAQSPPQLPRPTTANTRSMIVSIHGGRVSHSP